MRTLALIIWFACWTPVFAQEDWAPPPPPRTDLECVEEELRSDPSASYRISRQCAITDIQPIGDYQYGIAEVQREIQGLQKTEVIRRFRQGTHVYLKERHIELRRAFERPLQLVCVFDMMEKNLLEAKLIKTRELENGKLLPYEEKLELGPGGLPELGIYTHGKTFTYMSEYCPPGD